jgi:DNA mismatch repair protein MutS2
MDEHALRVLEFYKVRDILKGYASSEPGRAGVDRIVPSADPRWVERSLKETHELMGFLDSRREFPISGLRDISTSLKKAAVEGSMLRPEDLLNVLSVAVTSRLIKASLIKAKALYPLLSVHAEKLGVFASLESEVSRSIGEDGEVLDSASPELKRIRRSLTVIRSRINKELEGILQDPAYAKAVQEPVITMRGDRYVLPLKPNFKMYIQGIVHDHSTSRSTVFVEPERTVELNNRLAQLKVDEKREVERVLYQLTSVVRQEGDSLGNSLEGLSGLDLIYAKACYAGAIGGNIPALSAEPGVIELKDARHPLLLHVKGRGGHVVPLDVTLGRDYASLVITGPNTGGKTVVLKTVGLIMLMAQAGIPIPAAPDSVLPVFENIFSDIGDEQSLEQNLSTFSSHMGQIVRILGLADGDSLVLLDELGAGTDPAEGSALGVAILEELHRRGCRVVATTHHSALKVFAANTPGVMNASVEFDPETLLPTYRLLIGRPGRSSALLVAARLGMPKAVVEAASKTKSSDDTQIDKLIEKLERETFAAREDRLRAALELARVKEEKARLQDLLKRSEEEGRVAVRKAKEKAAGVLLGLRQKMRELDELGRKAPDKAEVRKKALEIQTLEAELKSAESAPDPARTVDINKLAVGDTVKVFRYGKLGKVLSVNREKAQAVVQVEALKVTVGASELEPAGETELRRPKAAVTVSRAGDDMSGPGIELNIIGLRVDAALERVERYLDDCLLSGLNQARIIHGRGTGALRNAVRETLKSHRGVKSFGSASFEEGGDAVTVVEMAA